MKANGAPCGVVRKTYRPNLKQNEIHDGSVSKSDLPAVGEQIGKSDPLRHQKIADSMRRSDREKVTDIPATRIAQLTQLRITAWLGSEEQIAEAAEMAGLSPEAMLILSQLDENQLEKASSFNTDVAPEKSFKEWHAKLVKTASVTDRRTQRDFFSGDIVDVAFKGDQHSMAAPIFSLSTKPDRTDWTWSSVDGKRTVEVKPSSLGRATMHDKDILLYAISQFVAGLNRNREDAKNRTIAFRIFDYMAAIDSGSCSSDYKAVIDGLQRLHGTQIKTNIKTGRGKYGATEFFHLLEHAKIVEDQAHGKVNATVVLTLSDWLHNAVQTKEEVVTIAREYFKLRKPLEKRLYELARKECNKQDLIFRTWNTYHNSSGARCSMKEFRRGVRGIVAAGGPPDYLLTLSEKGVHIQPKKKQ